MLARVGIRGLPLILLVRPFPVRFLVLSFVVLVSAFPVRFLVLSFVVLVSAFPVRSLVLFFGGLVTAFLGLPLLQLSITPSRARHPRRHARSCDPGDAGHRAFVRRFPVEHALHVVGLGPCLGILRGVEVAGCLDSSLVVLLGPAGACNLGFLMGFQGIRRGLLRAVVGPLLFGLVVVGTGNGLLGGEVVAVPADIVAAVALDFAEGDPGNLDGLARGLVGLCLGRIVRVPGIGLAALGGIVG